MKWIFSIFVVSIIAILGGSFAFASPYGLGSYGTCTYDNTCSISMSTSGTVTLNATPTSSGVYTIDKDQVTVTTNSTAGYNLVLESTTNNYFSGSLIAPGLIIIAGADGSPSSPATLGVNRFGFRVDGYSGFGAGPTTAVTNQPSSALTFAGVPNLGSPVTIKNNTTGAPSGETTDVWYGIHVDAGQQAGIYGQTVMYTATML